MATNQGNLDKIDEVINTLLENGPLPDIRDQGRLFRFGDYLAKLATTRRELKRSGANVQCVWLGQDANLGDY